MWYIISITILSILLGFSLYLLYIALARITHFENYILHFERIIRFATEQMKRVDASGHYESDDETNFFFKQLKDLQ